MGAICCPKSQAVFKEPLIKEESKEPSEPEIQIKSYSSDSDKELSKVEENEYNYLRLIQFRDFAYLIYKFDLSNATVAEDFSVPAPKYNKKDAFFSAPFGTDLFQSFIENKFLKHPAIYTEAGNNENRTNIFKDIMGFMHKGLQTKIEQHLKSNGTENPTDSITKAHVLALGFLYCSSKTNVSKIKFLFDLFADSDGTLKPSKE